ncbi:MAG: hypothetical protein HOO06_07515 [Bdellovibrionaceae bacterium]|jgi:hypothetical protein|nr:hypothetical protein [Pseudobdellovibrionaceae bacterium]
MTKLLLILTSVFLLSHTALANISFESMDQNDVDGVVQDLASGFTHVSLRPASALGTIFGIEVAGYVGTTAADKISTLTRAADANAGEIILPHAGLAAAISVPYGVGLEFNLVPSFDADGAGFSSNSFAAKWTLTKGMLDLPVDLSVSASMANLSMSLAQSVPGATGQYDFDTTNTTLMFMISKDFMFIEPYFGFGSVSISGDTKFNATASDSGFTFTTGNSISSSLSGTQLVAGVQLNLLFLTLGFETGTVMGASRSSFKLGLKF